MTDYAVILTRDRPALLCETVDAIAPQVDLVVVVDNNSRPPVQPGWEAKNYMLVRDTTTPLSIGKMWNERLDLIAGAEGVGGAEQWNVALLCDDAAPPPGWFADVTGEMRAHGTAAASTHSYQQRDTGYTLTALSNDRDRMCPWAFVVAGERAVRADTSMRWHYVDTDFDWQCRRSGGVRIAAGPPVVNGVVGGWNVGNAEMVAQAERDRVTFDAKWRDL